MCLNSFSEIGGMEFDGLLSMPRCWNVDADDGEFDADIDGGILFQTSDFNSYRSHGGGLGGGGNGGALGILAIFNL